MVHKSIFPNNRTIVQNQSVYDSISPVLTLSKFATACVLKRHKESKIYVFSPLLATISATIIILTSLHLIYIPICVERVEKDRYPEGRNISLDYALNHTQLITKLLNPMSVSLGGIIFRLIALFSLRLKLPEILEKIHRIDGEISITPRQIKKHTRNLLICTFLTLLFTFPFQLYSVWNDDSLNSIFLFNVNLYNNFSSICGDLQYIAFCYIFYTRFVILNSMFKKIIDTLMKNPRGMMQSSNAGCSKIEENQILAHFNGPARKLYIFRRCFIDLCASISYLNHIYSFHLLISLATSSANALLNFYYAIFGGFKDVIYTSTIYGVLNDLIWSVYYLGRLIFVCVSTEILIQEVNNVKEFMSTTFDVKYHMQIKEEVWSLLVYCLSKDINVTACGLFQINAKLITATVATGTTYLVILAQFHGK